MTTDPPRPRPAKTPRRVPQPEQRGQAAAQTRERIIAAAVEEFGAKGYAGARTAGIAERAGVNQQLIAYYFGGKQGLLDELRRRWTERSAEATAGSATFLERFEAYMDATLDEPDWAKLVLWQALGDGPSDVSGTSPGDGPGNVAEDWQPAKLAQAVNGVRARQEAGEITADLDPEFVLLLAYALTFAPLMLPRFVAGVFGVSPDSPEYRRRCRDQLARVIAPAPLPTGKQPS